jgi:hypothetical protein
VKLFLARYSASSSPSPRQWLAKSLGRLLHPHVCQVHALLFVPRISLARPAQHLHGSIAMLPPHASCASPILFFLPWLPIMVSLQLRPVRTPAPRPQVPGRPADCLCIDKKISLLGVSIHHFSLPLQTSRDRQPCPGAQPRRHLPPPRRNRSGAHGVK